MNQIIDDSKSLTHGGEADRVATMKRDLEAIRNQKAEAERELKKLDAKRAELDQWLRDLSITERTLARMLDLDIPDDPVGPTLENPRRKKPDHIPSVHDMAVQVLRDRGDEFVEGQDIVAGIKSRWWPSVTNNDVLPTLWRLATKDNRLRKEGTKYALPIRNGLLRPFALARAES